MALLLGKKTKVLMAMRKEAKRRGLGWKAYMESTNAEELIALCNEVDPTIDPAELIEGLPSDPPVDATNWGLPPRHALRTDLISPVPVITNAVTAARAGDWRPAAHLLNRSYGDWAMRAAAVHALAETVADDRTWLEAWRAAGTRDDKHIAAVDAQGLLWLAWKLRGDGNNEHTSAQQHDAFVQVLPQAEAAAWKAAEMAQGDPTPWNTLVTLAMGLQYDNPKFGAVWRELLARDPLHRSGHEFAAQYWSGYGADQMRSFALQAASASPSLAFLIVQAAAEIENETENENVWKMDEVQRALDAMLHWLATPQGGGSVDASADRRWAAYGLVCAGRGAEAVPLFQQLGVDASGTPWHYWGDAAIANFDRYRRRACAATLAS